MHFWKIPFSVRPVDLNGPTGRLASGKKNISIRPVDFYGLTGRSLKNWKISVSVRPVDWNGPTGRFYWFLENCFKCSGIVLKGVCRESKAQ